MELQRELDRVMALWRPDFTPHVVGFFRVGSHSHGTHVPPADPAGIDDTDYMLVVIPPRTHVYGLGRFEHAVVKHEELDVVIYEWRKYIGLLLKANPNVVGTLWLHYSDMLAPTLDPLTTLLWNRAAFSSQLAAQSFIGYALDQLYKMEHFAHKGYMGAKRKELVSRFGYDVKNAAHLVRLLRMGTEFLETGEMVVRRPDADELISIKRGEWTLEQVKAEADRWLERIRTAESSTALPARPNEQLAQAITMYGYEYAWPKEHASGVLWAAEHAVPV